MITKGIRVVELKFDSIENFEGQEIPRSTSILLFLGSFSFLLFPTIRFRKGSRGGDGNSGKGAPRGASAGTVR
jgi:hypothetical protein